MPKVYEFEGHNYELDVTRIRNIKCKVWESKEENSNIVVFSYGYGMNSEYESVEVLAEGIVKKYNTSVVVVEYTGTSLKYSDDLLTKLENYLPDFLQNINEYLPNRVQELIKQRRYQDAINDLYFNAFARYPLNENTIMPIYGDLNIYNDFGLIPAFDIIYALKNLRKIYTCWNWNDCIGFGKDYGAYLIEMTERLCPGIFSMIINVHGNILPLKEDLFYNMTEWKYGSQRNAYKNQIGRFPIYLVEAQGWTTNQQHQFAFKPRHFDIRNLLNEDIVKSNYNVKQTPRIYVDLYNINKDFLEYRKRYIDLLIKYDYSIEYFLVEEDDTDGNIFTRNGNDIDIDLLLLYKYYLKLYPNRNVKKDHENDLIWYPVYGGAYVIYDLEKFPKVMFANNKILDENDEEISILFNADIDKNNDMINLQNYCKTPINIINDEYKKLCS